MSDKPKPKLCAAGEQLRREINRLYPKRDKASDGWIGNSAHAAVKSDHNPDPESGIVRAVDIDEDLKGRGRPDPIDANKIVRQIVQIGKAGDERLAYVIFEGRIWSRTYGWKSRPYSGLNAHNQHFHISFTKAGDDDGRPFKIVRPM